MVSKRTNRSPEVLMVGSVALDDIRTPFGENKNVLGGSATYASCSASHFSAPAIVGVVGEDFPEEHVELLESRGIFLDGLQRVAGETFHWSGAYDGDMAQAKTFDTRLGVFETFSPAIPDSLSGCPWVLLGNIHPALQLRVLEQMKEPKFVAADTMNFWIGGERETLGKMISRVEAMLVNDAEIRQLTGITNLSLAAERLLEMGPEYVILKRGEHGVSVHSREGVFFGPAFPAREVRDPTGAGDSLAGGLLGYLARKGTVDMDSVCEGVMVGTVMSSFAIEDFSPRRLASLTQADIRNRLKDLLSISVRVNKSLDILGL